MLKVYNNLTLMFCHDKGSSFYCRGYGKFLDTTVDYTKINALIIMQSNYVTRYEYYFIIIYCKLPG